MPSASAPVSVFISSTCYDLMDLRSELSRFLEQHNFIVRTSDDYESKFEVDGRLDSISTCLFNVAASNVVVCIIDRRYGPPTGISPYESVSATHAEILHAEENGKPIFTFVRDQSLLESEQVLRNAAFNTRWLDSKYKTEVSKLIDGRRKLAEAAAKGTSNWFDLFRNSFEIRPLVLKRLLDQFPQHVGAFARKPEKIVRLYFVTSPGSNSDGLIKGRFVNAGNGPALDLRIGWRADGEEHIVTQQGALLVGQHIPEQDKSSVSFPCPKRKRASLDGHAVVFCEYQNASGERYRLEVEHAWGDSGYHRIHPEQFKVSVGDQWLIIN